MPSKDVSSTRGHFINNSLVSPNELGPNPITSVSISPELMDSICHDGQAPFSEVLCYGIGHIGMCQAALHQVALLTAMVEEWKASPVSSWIQVSNGVAFAAIPHLGV